jgi:hypothetical protein
MLAGLPRRSAEPFDKLRTGSRRSPAIRRPFGYALRPFDWAQAEGRLHWVFR